MPAGRDQAYEEALALWRALSDKPPPAGDAKVVIDAAMRLAPPPGYDRLANRWLNDHDIQWAVYRTASSRNV
jgi:hypothetical protein